MSKNVNYIYTPLVLSNDINKWGAFVSWVLFTPQMGGKGGHGLIQSSSSRIHYKNIQTC
jgi:hypothetical protein